MFYFPVTGHGLKCFRCNGKEADCTKKIFEGNKTKYVENCSTGQDTCIRTWSQKEDDDNSYVSNMCMEKQACEDLEKKCEDKELKDENDKPLKCAVACCSTDECNGSSEVYFSVIFLAACSIFGQALIK